MQTRGTSSIKFALAAATAIWVSSPAQAVGVFDIQLNFDANAFAGQQRLLDALFLAETFWEDRISGYKTRALADAAQAQGAFQIEVGFDNLGSRTLGAASVIGFIENPNSTGISDRFIDTTIQADGYFLHSRGRVQWNLDGDYSDLSAPTLETIAVHEFAHALGFNPRIFLENGVVPTDPDAPDAERAKYIGENALAAYNEILGTAVDFVPLELGGGAGTAFSHWDEYEFMNHGVNNGILPECDLFESDSFDCFLALPIEERQRVSPLLDNPELMTGWLSVSSETPLQMSPVTLAVFSDIGYSLAGTAAVPVPPAGLLLLGGIAGLAGMRQRAGSSLD